jgi:hypothetical protein
MCSLAASSFCVQGGETYDRVGADPGLRSQRGHLSRAAGITRFRPRPVHLLPHGQVRGLAIGQPTALSQLPRLLPTGLRAVSGKAHGLIHPIQRLARLLAGRNPLRRPHDRMEGATILVLTVAFLATMMWAAFLGARLYQSQLAVAAQLRPATAILTQDAPRPDIRPVPTGQVLAHWPGPGGREKSGMLEAVTTPGISGAVAGARVLVWLNRLGQPVAPPPGRAWMMVGAVLMALAVAAGIASGLLIPYRLCRLVLDRRRLAAWESAWASTGPRWTSRR